MKFIKNRPLIGEAIRLGRLENNFMTQEQLANSLNVDRTTISNWETGRRDLSLKDAIKIANLFGKSLDSLFNHQKLNSRDFLELTERYFNNDEISEEEKDYVYGRIYDIKRLSRKK